jgi:hypothetical protein
MNEMRGKRVAAACWLVVVGLVSIVGCDPVQWATLRVQNMSSLTLESVRLIGVEPDPITFGTCGPEADVRKSFAEPLVFGTDIAMEFAINGHSFRQPLNASGNFPKKLRNRNKIIDLHFTTNRVWTWTLKDGRTVK